MPATQIDRERDLCTSSKFLQTYKLMEFAFITLCETRGKMENTTSLDPAMPSFNHRRILCTKILNQLKMLKKL